MLTVDEQRLSDLLKRAVPEPSMELSADRVTSGAAIQGAGRSRRRPWLIPVLAAGAAGAAAATVIALPSSASHPATGPSAGSSAKPAEAAPGKTPAAQALPTKVPTSVSPVTYSFGPARTDLTAAYVLDKAASALGSQPAPDSGWLAGADWHTESQWTCGNGRVYTNNTWWDASGNGVGWNTGPTSGDPGCDPGGDAPYPIVGVKGEPPASIGQKAYTWAQLGALPTDPDELYAIVKADERLPFSSTDPGAPESGQSDLIQSIWNLLATWPVPPELRKALYQVAAMIPGVTVDGTYTDSLGRSGTALHVGMWTMVVDTGNGQILAMLQAATPASGALSGSPASTSVYISQGWVSPRSSPLPIQDGTRGATPASPAASAASRL